MPPAQQIKEYIDKAYPSNEFYNYFKYSFVMYVQNVKIPSILAAEYLQQNNVSNPYFFMKTTNEDLDLLYYSKSNYFINI